MLNPFQTTKVLIGAAHKQFITKYIQLGAHVGFKEIFLIRGLEGGIEPFPNRETKVCTNKVFSLSIIPKELSENLNFVEKLSVKDNADICLSILKREDNPFKEWALLTAGLIISAYETTDDIKKSISLAEESLNSGAAWECFEVYKSLSNNQKTIF